MCMCVCVCLCECVSSSCLFLDNCIGFKGGMRGERNLYSTNYFRSISLFIIYSTASPIRIRKETITGHCSRFQTVRHLSIGCRQRSSKHRALRATVTLAKVVA
jgi:hypothetical protein